MNESSSVAKRDEKPRLQSLASPEAQAIVEANRARNAIATAIRGTQWGGGLSLLQQRAIAEYCRQQNLDPIRHVEVLGGRLYLVAELYDEKGAPLIQAGEVIPLEPDFIHVDDRLEKLAAAGDEWAKTEVQRRLRLRIKHAAPEEAKATCVWSFKVRASGAIVTGVNWCGGGTRKKHTRDGVKDADPIGDLEPTKTAETRARRRAWRKIANIIPAYGAVVKPIEEAAQTAIPVAIVEPEEQLGDKGLQANLGSASDPYQLQAGEVQRTVEADEDLALDRAIAERENGHDPDELPLGDRRARARVTD